MTETYWQDNTRIVYNKDCRDMYELKQDRFSNASIVEGFDLVKQSLFSLNNIGVYNTAGHYGWLTPSVKHNKSAVLDAGQFLQPTQLKQYHSLFMLNNKIIPKCFNQSYRFSIADRPSIQRLTFFGGWFLNAFISPKVLRQHIYNFRADLFQSYFFTKYWLGSIISNSHRISASLNGKVTIAIQTARQIRFDNLIHKLILPHPRCGCQVKEVMIWQ